LPENRLRPDSSGYQREEGPETLGRTLFHPAAPPCQPADLEKQQNQAKADRLGGVIGKLRSLRVDDALLADVEIYYEARVGKRLIRRSFPAGARLRKLLLG